MDPILKQFLTLPFPRERIALKPKPYEARRVLVVNRKKGEILDMALPELPSFALKGDLWILNISKVIPALTFFHRTTGGKVEILWIQEKSEGIWEGVIKGKIREGETLPNPFPVRLIEKTGKRGIFSVPEPFLSYLNQYGHPPLPPYIRKERKKRGETEIGEEDRYLYQTPHALTPGSIAAPTAGFHLYPQLRKEMEEKGGKFKEVTLHVGIGTFMNLKEIPQEGLPPEWGEIPKETEKAILSAKEKSERIVAVGTTVVRVVEGLLPSTSGWVNIFIQPGYSFQWISSLFTNFHLPNTPLRLLIATFLGPELSLEAYRYALKNRSYLFYSYGDAMWIV